MRSGTARGRDEPGALSHQVSQHLAAGREHYGAIRHPKFTILTHGAVSVAALTRLAAGGDDLGTIMKVEQRVHAYNSLINLVYGFVMARTQGMTLAPQKVSGADHRRR